MSLVRDGYPTIQLFDNQHYRTSIPNEIHIIFLASRGGFTTSAFPTNTVA
jgi:hypothetical protein